MVRILSCHHFRGQRIGRCDEAVGVAVTGEVVIVALEHQINIYGKPELNQLLISPGSDSRNSPPPPFPGPGHSVITSAKHVLQQPETSNKSASPSPHFVHELGTQFVYAQSGKRNTTTDKNHDSNESDTELRLSHSFSTIDLIDKVSYNEKGNYILCLEKREMQAHATTNVIRSYFHWERDHGSKPLRARIAGLVSPTGAEPEDDSLMMVEIPLTSPPTAVASCNLTGHLACLSAESIVNIFLFRAKEVTGRVRVHYYDFDRTYAIELTAFAPDQLHFSSNYVVCLNPHVVHVFCIKKEELVHQQELPEDSSAHAAAFIKSPVQPTLTNSEKVVFDPKNESVKVYLPSIMRANRKRKSPSSVIHEEFQDEITTNHSKVVFCSARPGIYIQDVLRVGITSANFYSKFTEVAMQPIRIKNHLAAVSLMICTLKEGFLYHLPSKPNGQIIRTASYPFTAPLISFGFDSIFVHALTETGLESYTSRSLFYASKDVNGITQFVNDCPLHDEVPSLIGIRPFVNVKKMACDSRILCILACSMNTINKAPTTTEEPTWTIYTLDLPDIESVYEDMMRTAQFQAETNPEARFALLCEAYIVLKQYIDAHPEQETAFAQRYKEVCKLIGLAYLQSSVTLSTADSLSSAPSKTPPMSTTSVSSETSSMSSATTVSGELVDKGVTYLLMGRCGVNEIFSPENWAWIREPRYIPGFVRLIEVTFLKSKFKEVSSDNQKLSPTLAPVVVEFLATNGPNVLVELIIEAPFIRECNSKRLVQILQNLAETGNYPAKETLALVLTLVTVGSVEQSTRTQINDLLHKTKLYELSSLLTHELLLETRGQQQTFLTDLAVCFIASDNQQIVSEKIVQYLNTRELSMSLVLLAFAQAVNVNADNLLQHRITKCLTSIVEAYISEKLKKSSSIGFTDEDKRALQLLVRTYLSSINFSSSLTSTVPPANSHQESPNKKVGTVLATPEKVEPPHMSPELFKRYTRFGSICTCVNFVLSINSPGGYLTPQSQNIATVPIFVNEESRENFIKLLSLLSNLHLTNLEGIKDIVLTYLYKNATQVKPSVNSTLYIILQVLAETPEKAVNILLAKQPTTIMLFAKETFEKVPTKWKILVNTLKKKMQSCAVSNVNESEIYATILESVYLHLANFLTPLELEQVLDKETEESTKFHKICSRVELANTYANMVISVSTDFLTQKQ